MRIIPPTRLWRQLGWVALTLSVLRYIAVSRSMHQPFYDGGLKLRFFDLRIYRAGAERVAHGGALYQTPMLHHLGFTYPPFAALVMLPLTALSPLADRHLVTVLNVALLVFILRRTLLLIPRPSAPDEPPGPGAEERAAAPTRPGGRARAWSLAAAIAAFALWLEPVSVTLGYGQVNLLITALVVLDLSRPDTARSKGVAIGLAAAIKLTPLMFIPYLWFSGRRRAAALAAWTFAATIALTFLVLPVQASNYWFRVILETRRIGKPMDPTNQSLLGGIARLTHIVHPGPGYELIIAAVALTGLGLAVRASRRGDEAAGFSLAAVTTLLASPISWDHHWTLAVPALVLLSRRAVAERSARLAVAATVVWIVGYAYLPELAGMHYRHVHGLDSILRTDPYPVLGLLCLLFAGTAFIRPHLRTPRRLAVVRRSLRPLGPAPGLASWTTPRPTPTAAFRRSGGRAADA